MVEINSTRFMRYKIVKSVGIYYLIDISTNKSSIFSLTQTYKKGYSAAKLSKNQFTMLEKKKSKKRSTPIYLGGFGGSFLMADALVKFFGIKSLISFFTFGQGHPYLLAVILLFSILLMNFFKLFMLHMEEKKFKFYKIELNDKLYFEDTVPTDIKDKITLLVTILFVFTCFFGVYINGYASVFIYCAFIWLTYLLTWKSFSDGVHHTLKVKYLKGK